jgi:cold shock CspA family protein
MVTTGPQRGTVVAFDDDAGYGAVRSEGGDEHFFHCTAIADGSRTIEVGAVVVFEVVAGHRGRWEAAGVTVVPVDGGR